MPRKDIKIQEMLKDDQKWKERKPPKKLPRVRPQKWAIYDKLKGGDKGE